MGFLPRSRISGLLLLVSIMALFLSAALFFIGNESPSMRARANVTRAQQPRSNLTEAKPSTESAQLLKSSDAFTSTSPDMYASTRSMQPVGPYGVADSAVTTQVLLELRFIGRDSQLPVKAGRITLTNRSEDSPVIAAELGPDGRVQTLVHPENYLLKTDCPGYFRRDLQLQVPAGRQSQEKTLQLDRAVYLRGIVRDSKGLPKPGARVLLFQENAWFQTGSDYAGKFESQIQPQVLDRIFAVCPPHRISVLGPIPIKWGSETYIEMTLPEPLPEQKVFGKVLDNDGKPVSGAFVTIRTPSKLDPLVSGKLWVGGQWLYPSAKSDLQGNFSLEALPKSSAQLDVQAEGYEPYQAVVDTTGDVEKYVFLRRPEIFSVVVLDEGGRVVNDMKIVGDTEDDDLVLNTGSREGEYYSVRYPFRIYAQGTHTNQGISYGKWIDRYQKQIVLTLGRSRISGTVTREDGKPVTEFSISVNEIENSACNGRIGYFVRSEDGTFTLENLPPGKASITIMPPPATVAAGQARSRPGMTSVVSDIMVDDGRTAFVRAILKEK